MIKSSKLFTTLLCFVLGISFKKSDIYVSKHFQSKTHILKYQLYPFFINRVKYNYLEITRKLFLEPIEIVFVPSFVKGQTARQQDRLKHAILVENIW